MSPERLADKSSAYDEIAPVAIPSTSKRPRLSPNLDHLPPLDAEDSGVDDGACREDLGCIRDEGVLAVLPRSAFFITGQEAIGDFHHRVKTLDRGLRQRAGMSPDARSA